MNIKKECDLLVIGSGAGGLSTAITAKHNGLDVQVIEKADVYGGTTAFAGGVLWIPCNHHGLKQNPNDTLEAAEEYMRTEAGEAFDQKSARAFLDKGAEMVDFFEQNTSVQFIPTLYPDYHPTYSGGVDIGRSILAKPFNITELGKEMKRLRPPLRTITFIGMMFNSSNADLKHFFKATKSFTSFIYVCKRLANHMVELIRYGRAINVTSGNALAARLAKSSFDLNIPIHTSTAVEKLLIEEGKVVGVLAKTAGGTVELKARKGVVLAAGGFAQEIERIKKVYPHLQRGGEHHSPVPVDNTGDSMRMVEEIGVEISSDYKEPAAWMPTSVVPFSDGTKGMFPHLLDRYKPGVIGISPKGERFCNESESYHDVGTSMTNACTDSKETYMWLVCDSTCLGKYGLGYVKPAPLPYGSFVKNGYLKKGSSLEALAAEIGVDTDTLKSTIDTYNKDAVNGQDPMFNRGATSFNRYLADPDNQPNPCVAPILKAPFFALKVYMGDLGTFSGIPTDNYGAVLRPDGTKVEGLFAVGNDRHSVMGGTYPAAGITLGPIMTAGYVTGRHLAGIDDHLE
ncbi:MULTISPECIES: FAD-dependent oxidoreductase [unclassified Marinobacterium]|jgi:succinate dehydrogenase/fumarate reductase flavoprotein subunit|uniref:FAD-dependent oxidoreductase n=1 Tax=unclassified Marinobacterium TaxID=2644139 RepID=UPI001569DA7F|nr:MULTISPECIES: FAD-dependent oxidoreductase [unclassified Marinobacterium]NRP27472.1 3-oxosteroid 1-dehydrogenase [Marinobacterium sp. xm-d-420]NRP52373.1 3-oxosteroid 1-dehydrogenase [Marinobacterium sp. xm-v-242]NRP76954.1 3-oxosteroid 1-dehydrogenase [Marinobacterium sp. xm-m-383]